MGVEQSIASFNCLRGSYIQGGVEKLTPGVDVDGKVASGHKYRYRYILRVMVVGGLWWLQLRRQQQCRQLEAANSCCGVAP